MRRTTSKLLLASLLLPAGAAIAVLTAWAAAAWSDESWIADRDLPPDRFTLPAYLRGSWPPPVKVTWHQGTALGTRQITVLCVDPEGWAQWGEEADPWKEGPSRLVLWRSSFGWPWHCLHYDLFGIQGKDPAAVAAWNNARAAAGRHCGVPFPTWVPVRALEGSGLGRRPMPLAPHWPALLANTLFYAAILALLWPVPRILIRARRRRRGLCERCAYPAGVSSVCTECGATLPERPPNRRLPA